MKEIFMPWYVHKRNLAKAIKQIGQSKNFGKVLDIGCGDKPYEKLIKCKSYFGIEWEGGINPKKEPDMYYNGHTLPFPNNSFDTIVMFEVLEHLENYDIILSECYRVLTPKGRIIISAPFLWEEHNLPYDYFRYTDLGMVLTLTEHFDIEHQKKIGGTITTFLTMFNMFLYDKTKHIQSMNKLMKLFVYPLTNIIMLLLDKKPNKIYCSTLTIGVKR